MCFSKSIYEVASTHSVAKLAQNKNVLTVIFRQTLALSEAQITRVEEVAESFTVYNQRAQCTWQTDSSETIH